MNTKGVYLPRDSRDKAEKYFRLFALTVTQTAPEVDECFSN